MINKAILKEGKVRFLGGSLADFSRLGTLFHALLFAHFGAALWLLGIHHLSPEESFAYLPKLEMAILIDAACAYLACRNYAARRSRTLKLLRYGLNIILPALNVVCWEIVSWALPFLPDTSPTQTYLYSALFIWLIFLVLECQHTRLMPSLAEARLQALQNRIHPHFLFNSLNSVLALIRHQPAQAERLLEDMCELFRAVLQDHHTTVLIDEELKWCQRYLDIEHTRLGERLTVIWNQPDTLPLIQVPPLLVQPLIENAVHHGISPSTLPGTLLIEVRVDEHHLYLRIENPLPDRPAARTGQRIALDNIQQRLAICFGGEAYLNTYATPERFTAELVLPLPETITTSLS